MTTRVGLLLLGLACVALTGLLLWGTRRSPGAAMHDAGANAVAEPGKPLPVKGAARVKQEREDGALQPSKGEFAARMEVSTEGRIAPGERAVVRWRARAEEDLSYFFVGVDGDEGVFLEREGEWPPNRPRAGQEMSGSVTIRFPDDEFRHRVRLRMETDTGTGKKGFGARLFVVNEKGPVRTSNRCLTKAEGGPSSCDGSNRIIVTATASEALEQGVEATLDLNITPRAAASGLVGRIELPPGVALVEGELELPPAAVPGGESRHMRVRVRVTTDAEGGAVRCVGSSPADGLYEHETLLFVNENGKILH